MKIGIVILLILGLIAAACAALLMGTLRIKSSASGQKQAKIEVAMAMKSLNAGTIISKNDINTESVSRDELPQGKLVGPLKIIGRVLAWPIVEGQVFTEACLVPEGTPSILASQIPKGMRVFSVPITSRAKPDHILLYPGCVVDVLVEYKLSRNSKGEALSTTMFRGLRVLAISGDTVISNPDEEDNGKKSSSSRRGGLIVSLLVEPKQAEALQLAAENGSITMSLRNPVDDTLFAQEGSVLNRSTLINSGDTINSIIPSTYPEEQDFTNVQVFDPNDPLPRITSDNPQQDSVLGPKMQPQQLRYPKRLNSRWQVEMILGRQKTIEEFDNPENKTEKTETKK
jgi:Flp pilus assembly protein CpaB